MIEKARMFFNEVVSELKKVSWPTRKETINLTMVVIVLIVILGIFLGIIDGILAKLIGLIIR